MRDISQEQRKTELRDLRDGNLAAVREVGQERVG